MRKIHLIVSLGFLAASASWAATVLDPKQIPAQADLMILTPQAMSLNAPNTYLVKWRGADPTQPVANITFQYFPIGGSGNTTPYPDRSVIRDGTANDQRALWSDNAIQIDFVKGNLANSAILIYTDNKDAYQISCQTACDPAEKDDPLYSIALRGGAIGGASGPPKDSYRVSALPLVWKAVALQDLRDAVSADTVSIPVLSTSPLNMATEVLSESGGPCPPEGPYNQPAGGSRPNNNGFCDFSTHYVVDMNNNIHIDPANRKNSWYGHYPPSTPADTRRTDAFRYASVVGPYGVNVSEAGLGGGGAKSPAYILLGLKASSALLTHYATTIYLEVWSN